MFRSRFLCARFFAARFWGGGSTGGDALPFVAGLPTFRGEPHYPFQGP